MPMVIKSSVIVVAVVHRLGAAETSATSLRDFFEEELLGLIPDLAKRVGTPKTSSSSLVKCY